MRCVQLTLTAGGREAEVHPMYDLLANGECVDHATAIHWSYTGSELAMLHYVEGDVERFRTAARGVPHLVDLEVVTAGEGACYSFVNCETTSAMRRLFGPLQEMTAIPVPPVTYHPDGRLSFAIVGPAAELQAAIEAVPEPIEVSIDEIGDIGSVDRVAETSLSPRQREALDAAVALGYYEIPREADHRAVADAIDCAPSTAAEHLRKAEETVLTSVADGDAPVRASPRS